MLRRDVADPANDQAPDLYGAVIVGGLTLAVPIRERITKFPGRPGFVCER